MNPIVSFFLIAVLVFAIPIFLLRFGKEYLIGLFPIYAIIGSVFSKSHFQFFEGLDQSLAIPIIGGTFLITDLLSEHYGKKEAIQGVWIGLIGQLVFLLILILAINSDIHFDNFTAYNLTFGTMPRFLLGSIVGYIVSQFLDIYLYHKMMDYTGKDRGLFLRNNVSTGISQLVYTTIVMFIGYWGVAPYESLEKILTFIVGSWLLKIVLALVDYPFIYASIKLYHKT